MNPGPDVVLWTKRKEDGCHGKGTAKSRLFALRQAEGGKKVSDICREMGVSPAGLLQLEAALRRVGFERIARVAAVARREPEAEDAGGGPDVGQAHLAGGAVKKSLKPAARRELVREIRQAHQLSENRACGLVGITRWINRYQSRRDRQDELRMRLRELAGSRLRYGYRR